MKKIAGVATFPGREKAFIRMLESIEGQFDEIYYYDNGKLQDLTDNGKFYGLTKLKEPCYFFSLDDDLIYPPDYSDRLVQEIETRKCIVACHGRILKGLRRSYYTGHKAFRCLGKVDYSGKLDVAGTGVTAFRTDYFLPKFICYSEDKRMSDLVFSYWAAKEGKRIEMIPHPEGWIKQIPVSNSIAATERFRQSRQGELADSIFLLHSS